MYTQSCPTLCSPMTVVRQPPLSMEYCPGKNTGMGCHFLLQGIFPTQGSCVSCTDRQILYHWATWEYIYIFISATDIYIYISVYKNIYHTYQGQIKLWTFKHQLLSMGRWGNGWLGLHKLITKENREAFNPILNKAELNIHYKKE